jgi:menaquinone-dependent protoporphyrinogen IX oxidase
MKTLVVYYTRFGHTMKVAELLGRELDAPVRRIEEMRQRGFMRMGYGSTFHQCWPLKPMDMDCSEYDLVVLATPIWAGRPSCPTMTFLRDARYDGKQVALLIMRAGSDPGRPVRVARAACAKKNADIVLADSIITDKRSDEELLAAAKQFAARVRETAA